MAKKTTLMDIAKACNVSVATVSYVLSHSSKESISHETRLHIAEMATKLNYIPHTKKNLDFKDKYVSIVVNEKVNEPYTKKLMNMDLANELKLCLLKKGLYSEILYTCNIENDIKKVCETNLIGIFLIDIDDTICKKITNYFIAPIIFVDCDTTEYLFYKIFQDYNYIYNKALEIFNTYSLFIVAEDYSSQQLKRHISDNFLTKDVFINSNGADLEKFLESHEGYCGIVLGDLLGVLTERYFDSSKLLVISNFENRNLLMPTTKVMYIKNSDKAYYATEVLYSLIKMKTSKVKNNTIRIKPYL